MFEQIHGWIQANPLTVAVALCYLLTFVAVRQIKPILPHFPLHISWMPEDFRRRLVIRASVLVCGFIVSAVVSLGLKIFELCPITVMQILYISGSVGFLAPFVYDLLLGTVSLLEFMKVLPKGISRKIKWLIDSQKVEVVVDNNGEIEKVRDHGQTVWKRRR
jgi:hypothetical protein